MAEYKRTAAQKAWDFENARNWELEVSNAISKFRWIIGRFNSPDDLDIYVPGYYLELKEKNQKYTGRWTELVDFPEGDLFIIDELTIRRALTKYPKVFFLLRDNPGNRMFITPLWELAMLPAVRITRVTKGKRLYNMNDFHPLERAEDAIEFAEKAIVRTAWLDSGNVGPGEVPQV